MTVDNRITPGQTIPIDPPSTDIHLRDCGSMLTILVSANVRYSQLRNGDRLRCAAGDYPEMGNEHRPAAIPEENGPGLEIGIHCSALVSHNGILSLATSNCVVHCCSEVSAAHRARRIIAEGTAEPI